MSAEGGITTVTHGDFNVSSTGTTPEKLREALNVGREPESEETPDLSKAASDLGKKGGEAAAKARKAKPIPPKEKADAKGDADPGRASEAPERASTVDAGGSGDAEEVAAETESEEERKSRARQRVEEATRREAQLKRDLRAAQERHEAETRELRERLERIERGGKPPEQAPQEPAQAQKPQSSDFENYEEYLDARDEWNRKQWESQAARNFQAHTQASRYAQESQGMVTGWQGELNKAAAEDPEFRSRVAPVLDRIPLPSRFLQEGQRPDAANWIADDLMSAPADAKHVLRHFADNPGELERIAALQSPRAVTRELAKIVALSGDATSGNPPPERPASKPEQSKAQPPVRPVTGTPAVAGGPRYKPGMSLDDYARGWKP